MGEIRVMDQTGDTQIEWDPADKESTTKAEEQFKKLKKDGYNFFEVAQTRGKQVKKFTKGLGKLIAAPGVAKTETQRKTGRAMAGGPNAQRGRGLGKLPDGFGAPLR